MLKDFTATRLGALSIREAISRIEYPLRK
ncbi:MAG: hypothetical protein WDM78_04195 [Puia sp.]